jgi:hypothetical protein
MPRRRQGFAGKTRVQQHKMVYGLAAAWAGFAAPSHYRAPKIDFGRPMPHLPSKVQG